MYTYEYKGWKVTIEVDPEPVNPRGLNNLGTMVCFFDKQHLGDSHSFKSPAKVMAYIKEQKAINKAIYSSLDTPSLKGWEADQIGVIFAEAYKIYKQWNIQRITPKVKTQVFEILKKELNSYDQYLRGDVFCYSLSRGEKVTVDGSGSYYGCDFEHNGLLESARAGIQDLIQGIGGGNKEQYGLFDRGGA